MSFGEDFALGQGIGNLSSGRVFVVVLGSVTNSFTVREQVSARLLRARLQLHAERQTPCVTFAPRAGRPQRYISVGRTANGLTSFVARAAAAAPNRSSPAGARRGLAACGATAPFPNGSLLGRLTAGGGAAASLWGFPLFHLLHLRRAPLAGLSSCLSAGWFPDGSPVAAALVGRPSCTFFPAHLPALIAPIIACNMAVWPVYSCFMFTYFLRFYTQL